MNLHLKFEGFLEAKSFTIFLLSKDDINRICQHWEIHVNDPSNGKIPLKIKIEFFSLNKYPTKFCDISTPTSSKIGNGNKF